MEPVPYYGVKADFAVEHRYGAVENGNAMP